MIGVRIAYLCIATDLSILCLLDIFKEVLRFIEKNAGYISPENVRKPSI